VIRTHPRTILLCSYALLTISLLAATPLWLDEILQLGLAWHHSLRDLLPWIEVNPGAVPLPYFVQQLSLRLFGYSVVAARLPAALFSILAAATFAAVCDHIGLRRRLLALAIFLLLPLQFRYALEARSYSQAVFFSVATLWLFLKLSESPSLPLTALYGATVAVGLYFHPFLAFPVVAQLLTTTRRTTWTAATLAALCFVPWLILQHQARQNFHDPGLYPVGHLTPLVVLHDLTGGGYVSTVCLLVLAGFGIVRASMSAAVHRLLLLTVIVSIAGPLLGDTTLHYFFAGRQFLLAMPALVLLAAHGFDVVWQRSRLLAALPAVAFLGVASIKDFQDAAIPKDDLAVSAQSVATHLTSNSKGDSCVLTAPSWAIDYYPFFRPGVPFPACTDPIRAPEVIVVVSPSTSTPTERETLLRRLPGVYMRQSVSPLGHSELSTYRRSATDN
jgi:uncharacterized membrane protein